MEKDLTSDDSVDASDESVNITNLDEKNSGALLVDIMALLDKNILCRIKNDFSRWEGEAVPKLEFINLMLNHLPRSFDQIELTVALKELFDQIDVNHDEVMEWDEFSNYIVESGMIKKDRTFLDAIKNYKFQDWTDPVPHKNDIEHLFYLPKLKHLLVMETGSREFKVYDLKNSVFSFIRRVNGHRGAVTAACHANGMKRVATSANDLTINLWDESNYMLHQRISCPTFPLTMAWNQRHKTLYSSGTDAIIYAWDLKEAREKMSSIKMWNPFSADDEKSGHKTVVSVLLSIKKMNILVSADLHGKIFLWDMPQNTKRRQLNGQVKGIYSLDWNSEHSCLFSAGVDREAYVWNPYVEKEIFRLSGHTHSLIGVKCVPKTSQVVTGDISGLFKIWDIRTFSTIQSFSVGAKELNCFELTFPDKKIVAGSKKVIVYQYDEPQDQHLVDEGHAIFSFYNSLFNTFITVHAKTLKVWKGESGKIQHVFRDVIKGDISSAFLDKYQRKIYIGDSTGRIRSVNIKNGAKIKKFSRHKEEITELLHWAENRTLISSSWDKLIKIHDDSRINEENTVRYEISLHQENVSSISFHYFEHSPLILLASGSDDGLIHFTKLPSYRQDGKIVSGSSEVKCLKFLNPSSCLASVDADGLISFWVVNPGNPGKKPISQIQNYKENTDDVCVVKCIEYYHEKRFFYTGDENGFLKIYNVEMIVDKLAGSYAHMTFLTSQEQPSRFNSRSSYLFRNTETVRAGKVIYFRAHRDAINHICIMKEQNLIVTSSFDCNVHIWTHDGNKKGTLVLGVDKNWGVRCDMTLKEKSQISDAKNIIRRIVDQREPLGSSDIQDMILELPKSYENMIKRQGDYDVILEEEDESAFDEQSLFKLLQEPTNLASTEKYLKGTPAKSSMSKTSSYVDLVNVQMKKFGKGPNRLGLQRAGLSMLKLP